MYVRGFWCGNKYGCEGVNVGVVGVEVECVKDCGSFVVCCLWVVGKYLVCIFIMIDCKWGLLVVWVLVFIVVEVFWGCKVRVVGYFWESGWGGGL